MTEEKIELKNLKYYWERAKVKHIRAPADEGVNVTPEIADLISSLEHEELSMLTRTLWDDFVRVSGEMICKKGVARIAGMTVSWLDNSQCEKARKLRAIAVRYGTAQTTPVRFRRSLVQEICDQNEPTFPSGI